MNRFYLYRHIRLDKNVPFYVGIAGKKDKKFASYEDEYSRAFQWGRHNNHHWKNIVNKVGYEVEIIFECDTWEEVCSKEREFIKLYGRSDLGLGPLCNLTDGGEGSFGVKPSDETKRKMSEARRGKGIKHTEEAKRKMKGRTYGFKPGIANMVEFSRNQILQFTNSGGLIKEYDNIKSAAIDQNLHIQTISKYVQGKTTDRRGYIWKRKHLKKKTYPPWDIMRRKKVLQFTNNGELIKIYDNVDVAAIEVNRCKASIRNYISGENKDSRGFIWMYEYKVAVCMEKIS